MRARLPSAKAFPASGSMCAGGFNMIVARAVGLDQHSTAISSAICDSERREAGKRRVYEQ